MVEREPQGRFGLRIEQSNPTGSIAMSPRTLDGRIAIVTGGSSGIGRACALRLGQAGARVLVNYHRDAHSAAAVVGEIDASGSSACAFQADVGDEDDVEAMFRYCQEHLGEPDLLVSNAGIQMDAGIADMTVEDWDSVMRTNLRGPFLCARAAARIYLRHQGRAENDHVARSMVFVSSVHDEIPWAGHANYAASKAGLTMLMRTLAQELGPAGIRVNAVSPGAILTNINRAVIGTAAGERDVLDKIPLRRVGDPDAIARVVEWLASGASDYVHGHTLYADGGMRLYPSFMQGG